MILFKKLFSQEIKIFYLFIFLLISVALKAQNFNGQWKGGFTESSYGFSGMANGIDYVLELQTNGTNVTGYSYTYFNEGPKRYYTICRLKGTLNKEEKEVTVTEVERVKYNTPPDFQNCFQTHKLRYAHDSADVETLRGTWVPAPNQTGDCGYGSSFLSRKIVKPIALLNKPETKKIIAPQKKLNVVPKKITASVKPKANAAKPLAQSPIKKKVPDNAKTLSKDDNTKKDLPSIVPVIIKTDTIKQKTSGFEIRRKDIIKTIAITQPTFRVDFYDNGEVDGDSITVFYNNKIVLLHKMLTTKAITLTLALDSTVKENIITMYADNLGSIPPNTALMIVTDGDKRYEVRISSDLQTSGSIIFVHEK